MKEFALALSALTAPHHRWPMPPPPPAAVVQPAPAPRPWTAADRKALKRAIDVYCRRLKRGEVVAPVFEVPSWR